MVFQMTSKVSECGFEAFEGVAGSNFFESRGHPCSQSCLRASSECSRHSVRRSFFGMVEVGSDIGSESKQFQMSCNEFNSVKVSPSESPLVPVNASEVGSNESKTLSK